MSKNFVDPLRPQIIWHMRIACWIGKATHIQAHAYALVHPHSHMHTFSHAGTPTLNQFPHFNAAFFPFIKYKINSLAETVVLKVATVSRLTLLLDIYILVIILTGH